MQTDLSAQEEPLQEPVTHFGIWDKVDISGGRLYHPVEVVRGVLTIDLPYTIIHYGDLTKADELKLKDTLYELSRLLRFWVVYGDVEQAMDGTDLEDGRELTISLGMSDHRSRDAELRLLMVSGEGEKKTKMLGLAEIGAREMVTRDMVEKASNEDLIQATKVFEGPVWVKQVDGGVEGDE